MTPLLAAVFASVALQGYRGVPDPPVNVRVVDNILAEFLAGPVNPFTAAAATEALSIIVGLLDTSSPDNGHKEVGAAVRAAIKSLGEALLEMQVGPMRSNRKHASPFTAPRAPATQLACFRIGGECAPRPACLPKLEHLPGEARCRSRDRLAVCLPDRQWSGDARSSPACRDRLRGRDWCRDVDVCGRCTRG